MRRKFVWLSWRVSYDPYVVVCPLTNKEGDYYLLLMMMIFGRTHVPFCSLLISCPIYRYIGFGYVDTRYSSRSSPPISI